MLGNVLCSVLEYLEEWKQPGCCRAENSTAGLGTQVAGSAGWIAKFFPAFIYLTNHWAHQPVWALSVQSCQDDQAFLSSKTNGYVLIPLSSSQELDCLSHILRHPTSLRPKGLSVSVVTPSHINVTRLTLSPLCHGQQGSCPPSRFPLSYMTGNLELELMKRFKEECGLGSL